MGSITGTAQSGFQTMFGEALARDYKQIEMKNGVAVEVVGAERTSFRMLPWSWGNKISEKHKNENVEKMLGFFRSSGVEKFGSDIFETIFPEGKIGSNTVWSVANSTNTSEWLRQKVAEAKALFFEKVFSSWNEGDDVESLTDNIITGMLWSDNIPTSDFFATVDLKVREAVTTMIRYVIEKKGGVKEWGISLACLVEKLDKRLSQEIGGINAYNAKSSADARIADKQSDERLVKIVTEFTENFKKDFDNGIYAPDPTDLQVLPKDLEEYKSIDSCSEGMKNVLNSFGTLCAKSGNSMPMSTIAKLAEAIATCLDASSGRPGYVIDCLAAAWMMKGLNFRIGEQSSSQEFIDAKRRINGHENRAIEIIKKIILRIHADISKVDRADKLKHSEQLNLAIENINVLAKLAPDSKLLQEHAKSIIKKLTVEGFTLLEVPDFPAGEVNTESMTI